MAPTEWAPVSYTHLYGGGAVSFLCNLVWLIVSGLPLALVSVGTGLLYCITIIGIPFGIQCFKLAQLALMPCLLYTSRNAPARIN